MLKKCEWRSENLSTDIAGIQSEVEIEEEAR